MIQKIYKCTLLSDIVLNSKLATEGNLETLDSIPGSSFLGLVAHAIYKKFSMEEAYKLLHSNKVLFGDAHISDGESVSYAVPFSLFEPKEKTDELKDKVWAQFAWNKEIQKWFKEKGIQPKQIRRGYINENRVKQREVSKNFALKSAQDRTTRASMDGKMFGVSSLEQGQTFTFSIMYDSEDFIGLIEDNLIGTKFIGKSKSAQYGKVVIEVLANATKSTHLSQADTQNIIVYAESNLCFYNKFGHPTYQPEAKDLGIIGGTIDWSKSQIRTYSYSPWNLTRNSPNTQRHCIMKGSVFFIENGQIDTAKKGLVGEYLNEGLGRVLYNPKFLEVGENAVWQFEKNEDTSDKIADKADALVDTPLMKLLLKKKVEKENFEIQAKAIHEAVHNNPEKDSLKGISPSQWGQIREKATFSESIEALEKNLFDEETGFLCRGVSAEKFWNKSRNREKFEDVFNFLKGFGVLAIAKYAGELAKEASKKNKGK